MSVGLNMALQNQRQNDSVSQQEEVVNKLFEEVYRLGYMKGYREGYDEGVEDTTDKYKSVVSDGLRSGSSLSGKAMNELKK